MLTRWWAPRSLGLEFVSCEAEALDNAIASGSTSGFRETFEQLDELLAALG